MEYGKRKGLVSNRQHVMDHFRNRNELKEYLALEQIDFTKEEIFGMALQLPNAQDGVLLALLFKGVDYRDEFKELCSLTIHNVMEGYLVLHNRTILLDERTLTLIHRANEEEFYKSMKGDSERKYKLTPSPLIARGVRERVEADGKLILQRLVRVQKYFDYPKLNATNISLSGQVHVAKEELKKGRNMTEALDGVIKRFNLQDNATKRHTLELKIKQI